MGAEIDIVLEWMCYVTINNHAGKRVPIVVTPFTLREESDMVTLLGYHDCESRL